LRSPVNLALEASAEVIRRWVRIIFSFIKYSFRLAEGAHRFVHLTPEEGLLILARVTHDVVVLLYLPLEARLFRDCELLLGARRVH
jgi:hypothetical protein